MSEGREEIESTLLEAPLFSNLDQQKIKEIVKLAERVSFEHDEFIVREGDLASGFFFILDGQVEVRQGGGLIRRMGRGQFFGETALVENEPRTADVIAVQPSTCLKISTSSLKELIRFDPQIAIKILEQSVKRGHSTSKTSSTVENEVLEFHFQSEKTSFIFEKLVDSFIEDYMVKKIVLERCGWRSITDISHGTGISPSVLYGKHGGMGEIFEEPLKRGVVEMRYFPGERGRGGEVTRFRIAYEKEPIKIYVNQKVRAARTDPKVAK